MSLGVEYLRVCVCGGASSQSNNRSAGEDTIAYIHTAGYSPLQPVPLQPATARYSLYRGETTETGKVTGNELSVVVVKQQELTVIKRLMVRVANTGS